MNSYEILKRLELQEACNRLKAAMQEKHRVEVYASALQRKGKTLYSINRSRQSTIAIVVEK